MVIDQYHTTYRKDYIWPYVRAYGLRVIDRNSAEGRQDICKCECPRPEESPKHEAEEINWSRLAPMGPLLDPKLYPVKVGECPQSTISRFNQPNVFLEKLKAKYPYIYEILRTAPPHDMISRINRDRLRTTYQVDFCNLEEYPNAPYEDLLRAANLEGVPPCVEPIRLPGDAARPGRKNIAMRTALVSSSANPSTRGSGGRYGGEPQACVGTCHGPLGTMTAGATEYQDAISRLGMMIIRDKIHYASKKK